jgi:hypothetical protein
MNGAFGVLRKPVVGHHSEVDEEDDHRGWDMATAYDMTLETIQEEGQQNRRALAVVVGHYLSMASAEILKACHFHLLQQGEEEFPDGLSRGFLNDEG